LRSAAVRDFRNPPQLPTWAQNPETGLFVLIGHGFAQNSTATFWFDLCVRELPTKSLSVERHSPGARSNFDVFELQRLAAR
jgi:hypothetical protein